MNLKRKGDKMDKEYIGCGNCKHVSTPKGKQCYTMSRRLKELISDKGRIFSPEHVIPALIEIEKSCSRYRTHEVEYRPK